MIVVDSKKQTLAIVMKTSSPTEEIERITRAIAAAFRWRGNVDNSVAYQNDGENMVVLAELLE